MNNVLKKYLSEASTFMSDETISEGTKVDKDAAAIVIATEGKKEPTPASVATKQAKINKLRKSTIKEEGEEETDSDKLEEEEDITIDEEETEDCESCNEDEDDGAEDGEICEEDESCEYDGEGEEEGDEMADDNQIEDPKKKKMDIKESYIANASRWMYDNSYENLINESIFILDGKEYPSKKEAIKDLLNKGYRGYDYEKRMLRGHFKDISKADKEKHKFHSEEAIKHLDQISKKGGWGHGGESSTQLIRHQNELSKIEAKHILKHGSEHDKIAVQKDLDWNKHHKDWHKYHDPHNKAKDEYKKKKDDASFEKYMKAKRDLDKYTDEQNQRVKDREKALKKAENHYFNNHLSRHMKKINDKYE